MKKIIYFLLLTSFTLFFGTASAQISKVENQMSGANMDSLNVVLKLVMSNHNYLTRSAAGTQLTAALQEKSIRIKYVLPGKKQLSGAEVYKQILPSTLVLASSSNRATCYAVSTDGICITNYHVLEFFADTTQKQSPLFAITSNNNVFAVTSILAASKENDYAIIQVDTRGKKLRPLPIVESAEVGSDIYILGHPAHVTYFFSKGIVAKNFVRNGPRYPGEDFRMAVTADYSLGESGAPIVDDKGNLVGMVSAASALYGNPQDSINPQMALRTGIPVVAILQVLKFRK